MTLQNSTALIALLLLVGCASPVVEVVYNTAPPGAMIFFPTAGQSLDKSSTQCDELRIADHSVIIRTLQDGVEYQLAFVTPETLRLSPMPNVCLPRTLVVWGSGAKAYIPARPYPDSAGRITCTAIRPSDVPGYEKDLEFARQAIQIKLLREQTKVLERSASAQESAAYWQMINSMNYQIQSTIPASGQGTIVQPGAGSTYNNNSYAH